MSERIHPDRTASMLTIDKRYAILINQRADEGVKERLPEAVETALDAKYATLVSERVAREVELRLPAAVKVAINQRYDTLMIESVERRVEERLTAAVDVAVELRLSRALELMLSAAVDEQIDGLLKPISDFLQVSISARSEDNLEQKFTAIVQQQFESIPKISTVVAEAPALQSDDLLLDLV